MLWRDDESKEEREEREELLRQEEEEQEEDMVDRTGTGGAMDVEISRETNTAAQGYTWNGVTEDSSIKLPGPGAVIAAASSTTALNTTPRMFGFGQGVSTQEASSSEAAAPTFGQPFSATSLPSSTSSFIQMPQSQSIDPTPSSKIPKEVESMASQADLLRQDSEDEEIPEIDMASDSE